MKYSACKDFFSLFKYQISTYNAFSRSRKITNVAPEAQHIQDNLQLVRPILARCSIVYWWLIASRPEESKNSSGSCTGCFVWKPGVPIILCAIRKNRMRRFAKNRKSIPKFNSSKWNKNGYMGNSRSCDKEYVKYKQCGTADYLFWYWNGRKTFQNQSKIYSSRERKLL